MFESLSDRLTGALQGLRGKGRLTDADIDATAQFVGDAHPQPLRADRSSALDLPQEQAFPHRAA